MLALANDTMPDEYDLLLDSVLPKKNPRERVHSIASKVGLSPDIADDYLKLTNVESGHNINVRDNSKGAKGFGQVMPDVKGGSTRTVGGRRYNLKNPDENIEAGIKYFAEGGNDPVARRLYYFGGPRAKQTYEKTGRIPNISDGNMTASQYVRATGAQSSGRQVKRDAYDDLLDEAMGTPAPKSVVPRIERQKPPVDLSLPKAFQQARGSLRGARQHELSKQDLERPLYEAQAGQPATSSATSDELRVMKGEQPLDRQAYSRQQDAQVRLGKMQDESYREREARETKDKAFRTRVEPEIKNLTKQYRNIIKSSGVGGEQFTGETLTKGVAGIGELLAGITDSETLKKHSEAMQRAAEEEGASRDVATKLASDVIGGFIATAPELAAMRFGVNPVATFAGGSALRAGARTSDPMEIAAAAEHGGLTGLGFEVPGIGQGLKRVATKGLGVGATTGALEAVQGASPAEALQTGLVNAAVTLPGSMRGRKNARQTEAQRQGSETIKPARPETTIDVAQNPVVESSAIRPERRVDIRSSGVQPEPRSGSERVATEDVTASRVSDVEPQRFYHKDFGELVQTESQQGARRGRVRVAEVDNPESIHYVKRADLSGKGNQRLVPIKEAKEPELEQYLEPAQPVEPKAVERKGDIAPENVPILLEQKEASAPVISQISPERAEILPKPETRGETDVVTPAEKLPSQTADSSGGELGTAPRQASETAIKNAAMAADRVALDLPELAQAEPRKAVEVHERAKEANAKNPRQVDILTEQALRGDKNFTDVETAQVRLRAQEIKNRTNEVLREIEATNDPAEIAVKRTELETLQSEFDRLSEATKAAGTEWGRAGVARQQAIDQDFSLVAMKARVKADKGKPLTEKENAQIEDLDRRLRAAEERADKAEAKAAQNELERQLTRATRQRKRTETREYLDQEIVVIKSNIAAELARLKSGNIHASGLAGIDPEGRLTKELIKYVHNRAKANIGLKAEALIDEAHDLVKDLGVSRRQVAEALVGYGDNPKQRSEAQKRVAEINAEINKLLKTEDVEAGRRSTRQEGPKAEFTKNQTRLKQLQGQKAELERRIAEGDFSDTSKREGPRYTRETYAAAKEVDKIKEEYNRLRYKATRSTGEQITDELAKAAGVPKVIKSIGDLSAVFRQGGFYAITNPRNGLIKPTREMLRSFGETGYANVEAKIKADPAYEVLKKGGTDFTGVDRKDPNLSKHEEGYLGGETIDILAKGKYNPLRLVKGVKDISARTYVAFLDAQRLYIGKQMLDSLTPAQRANPKEIEAISHLLNIGTGRGDIPKFLGGNRSAPVWGIGIWAPRLLASRVQLLNSMISPRKAYKMPAGARKEMIKNNVKFLGATTAALGLIHTAGKLYPELQLSVNLDPDDSEFLKIRQGNTVYDGLTGLQQPLRFMVNMARAATPSALSSQTFQTGDYYAGKSMKEQIDPFEVGSFTRSKLNPSISPLVNYATGSDYMGRKFSAKREAIGLVSPLAPKDVVEAFQQEGLLGAAKATPSFLGIGIGSYPPRPEKPANLAEKMARRFVSDKMPDSARDDEQIEVDQKKAELRARSRRGEDVSKDIEALKGKITERQIKAILGARNKTRLQEDTNRLGIKDALLVYKVADPRQRAELKDLVIKKMPLIDAMLPDAQVPVRALAAELGITGGSQRPKRAERPERAERATRQ